ncbi:MAG: glycosyltransferase family 2 protein [Microthrixaceae bacterium]
MSAPEDFRYSVVIPVFNSEDVVGGVVEELLETFERAGIDGEVICVNDGSADRSWQVVSRLADSHPNVVALDLLRNYGQHNANLAGMREAGGDYVITMDDDGQNPPGEVLKLIEAIVARDDDVVFGQFETKRASAVRRLGSSLIGRINRRVFGQPDDLVVSNFRIMSTEVVRRISAAQTTFPYITGQALLASRRRSNVVVNHRPREVGASNYTIGRILSLVLRILFSYSHAPLRLASVAGLATSFAAFALGTGVVLQKLISGTNVPGWASMMVALAFTNGMTVLIVSMIGEYTVRVLQQVSAAPTYVVSRTVGRR